MIYPILVFLILTILIAVVTSIWSTATVNDRKSFRKLMLKSSIYSLVSVAILFFITILF